MKPVEGYCSVEWAIGCGGCCGKKSFLREEGSRGREERGTCTCKYQAYSLAVAGDFLPSLTLSLSLSLSLSPMYSLLLHE